MRKHRLITVLIALAAALFFFVPIRSEAASANVIDEANVLSSDQLLELNQLAQEITERQECGVYVVITDDMHGYSESKFAEYLFYNYDLGYGEGEGASGVILAISYGDSFYDSFSYGAAGDTFTMSRLDELNDLVYDYHSAGDWYGACEGFIKRCDELLTKTGYNYYVPQYTDPPINQQLVNTSPEQRRETWLHRLPFAGIGSALVGTVSILTMKGRNKNIGLAKDADRYIIKNGVKVTESRDVFINRTRSVTRIQRDSGGGGGGGGGSGHTYHSSGGTHSSGGHHF